MLGPSVPQAQKGRMKEARRDGVTAQVMTVEAGTPRAYNEYKTVKGPRPKPRNYICSDTLGQLGSSARALGSSLLPGQITEALWCDFRDCPSGSVKSKQLLNVLVSA